MASLGLGVVGGGLLTAKTPKTTHISFNSRVLTVKMSTTEKLGIKVEKNPPESKLTQLGIRNWPKWGCPASKFPLTYEAKEICYLLEGKVKVTPKGASESVEIEAGDLVEFPQGMTCTWDVSVAVDKHYKFE